MELPPPHVFACVIDEISTSPTAGGLAIERRRERGFSRCQPHEDRVELETVDHLADLDPETRRWLEAAAAPDPGAHAFTIRSFERRVWFRNGHTEQSYSERLFVVPGLGGVLHPTPPPAPRDGIELDVTAPLLFAHGSAGVLMHEIAGHRAESDRTPLALPPWLSVIDRPQRALDDAGIAATERNLSVSAATGLRRWRAIDAPLPRMSDVVVEPSGSAPDAFPATHFVVRSIADGYWDAATGRATFLITSAQFVRDGHAHAVKVPVRVSLRADAVIRRVAGAGQDVVRAPWVICGSHGSEVPVGSLACDLLLGEGDA